MHSFLIKAFRGGLLALGVVVPVQAQNASRANSLPAPALEGDRLLLWGGFDRHDRPVLEHTLLVRYGDGVRIPVGLFAPQYDIIEPLVVVCGDGSTHTGKWRMTCRRWFAVPGMGGDLGYGWEAEIPYVQDAREYRLSYLGKDIGGERFPEPPAHAWSRGSFRCNESLTPFEPQDDALAPSDVLQVFDAPVHQYYWDVEVSHGTAPHGTWMKIATSPGSSPSTVVRRGVVQVAWPPMNWYPRRDPPHDTAKINQWASESWAGHLFPVLLEKDLVYPVRTTILLRRSFGLTVFEDRLVLEAKRPPADHKGHRHSSRPHSGQQAH